MEDFTSPKRSRSPVLARAIAMELHVLPQGDRQDLNQLHNLVQEASEWRHVAGGLEILDRLLEKLSTTTVQSEAVKNFQVSLTNLKNEARQLKMVAHCSMFDQLDRIDAATDQLARHRDGTPFVTTSQGEHAMSSRLAAQAEEILSDSHSVQKSD